MEFTSSHRQANEMNWNLSSDVAEAGRSVNRGRHVVASLEVTDGSKTVRGLFSFGLVRNFRVFSHVVGEQNSDSLQHTDLDLRYNDRTLGCNMSYFLATGTTSADL